MDQRWKDLAKVLVNYSVEVKKGDKVLITMMEIETWDLARACYQEVVKAGGKPRGARAQHYHVIYPAHVL